MKNITKTVAKTIEKIGAGQANTNCAFLYFYEPKVPTNLLKKQK